MGLMYCNAQIYMLIEPSFGVIAHCSISKWVHCSVHSEVRNLTKEWLHLDATPHSHQPTHDVVALQNANPNHPIQEPCRLRLHLHMSLDLTFHYPAYTYMRAGVADCSYADLNFSHKPRKCCCRQFECAQAARHRPVPRLQGFAVLALASG